ncbi:DNA damage-inducible protein 1-like protein [Tanacetum coccineum]
MEYHLTPNQPVQVNKIASTCEICGGPYDTQYCMENPEQAFVDYASLGTDEARVPPILSNRSLLSKRVSTQQLTPKKDRLQVNTLTVKEVETPKPKEPALEDEFRDMHLNLLVLEVLAHVPTYEALLDKYIEKLELGKNESAFIQGDTPMKMKDPGLCILPCRLGNSKPFDTLADLGSCVNLIPLNLFKKLNIGLLKETEDALGLTDGTKSYPIGIVKNVQVHVGRLKLIEDFHVVDMEREPTCPLLLGIGFLATANAVIDCKKAKIMVGEGITRLIFGVKELDFG